MQVTSTHPDGTPKAVILDDLELLIDELHQLLVAQGYDAGEALVLMRGASLGDQRPESPALDAVLTPQLADWLLHAGDDSRKNAPPP